MQSKNGKTDLFDAFDELSFGAKKVGKKKRLITDDLIKRG